MLQKLFVFFTIALLAGLAQSATAIELSAHPRLTALAEELVREKRYTQKELERLFAPVRVQQTVLDAMQSPAEYKLTWGRYRKIFMQPQRIEAGVEFWQQHQSHMQRAEQEYGVPASMIAAIIGVESKYGRIKGSHKVLDSLVSLVVGYPRRSEFFARELKEFLILTQENQMDPHEILGSYAGAVGYPQFISSSYRAYAVDFSGDGKTDLIDQPVDAIGSVANYFVKNGWKPNQPVTLPYQTNVPAAIAKLANRKRKTKYSAGELRAMGAQIPTTVADSVPMNVLMLDARVAKRTKKSGRYIVRAGDTACEIAERLEVSCKALFSLNKLNQRGDIYRGQALKIPGSKAGSGDSKWEFEGDQQERPIFFYTHENFYAITQYNHSVLYAMAVYDLAQAIDSAMRSYAAN